MRLKATYLPAKGLHPMHAFCPSACALRKCMTDPRVQVVSACMVLTAPAGKIPKDVSWNAGKKSMGNVDAFLKSLLNFDKDNIPEKCVDTVEKVRISQSCLVFRTRLHKHRCCLQSVAALYVTQVRHCAGLLIKPQFQPRLHSFQVWGCCWSLWMGCQHLQVLPHLPGCCTKASDAGRCKRKAG